jgi:Uma2 family endonuclease
MPAVRSRPRPRHENIAELLHALGDIPPDRVRLDPSPGTATKRDLLLVHDRNRLCELIDGTLVEKAMGSPESFIALEIVFALRTYLVHHDIGFLYGADGLIQVRPWRVRGPDVSFTSWLKRPERTVPSNPISDLVPDLAVEVLSPRNTRREMERKLEDYFAGGVKLVWIIDPKTRTAEVYTGPDDMTPLDESGSLDGGDVLPGFSVPLATLFERLEKPKGKKKR